MVASKKSGEAPSLREEILNELRVIARRDLELELELQPSMTLKQELNLDSLGMIVVAAALENRFQVKLAEEDSTEVTTVADLLALVERRIRETRGQP